MADEQKQRYKEARNKRDKDKYCNMTDEERQKKKEYQKEYRKNKDIKKIETNAIKI